jgi:hypothetical protein
MRLHIAILSRADNGRWATHSVQGSRQSSLALRVTACDIGGIAAQSAKCGRLNDRNEG